MNDSQKSINNRKWISWLLKIPVLIVSLFLFLALLITLTLTFDFTKKVLLSGLVSIANNELEAEVSFGTTKLNIFNGITIENLLLTLHKTDTVFFVPKVKIDWDLSPLKRRIIFIKYVELQNPKINLIKELGDSLWNFEKIVKMKPEETTTSETDLSVFITKVKIINGNVNTFDKNHHPRTSTFDPLFAKVQKFNFNGSGKFFLKRSQFLINVDGLSFEEAHSNFHLKDLNASIIVDSSVVKVSKFNLETQETSINGVMSVLENGLHLDVHKSSIYTGDILKFVDIPLSNNSKVKVGGNVIIGDTISIKNISLEFGSRSNLLFNVAVYDENGSSRVDISQVKGNIQEKEVRELMPRIFDDIPIKFDFFAPNNLAVKINKDGYFFKGKANTGFALIDFVLSFDSNLTFVFQLNFEKFNLNKIQKGIPANKLTGYANGNLSLKNGINRISGNVNLNIQRGWADIKGLDNFQLRLNANASNGIVNLIHLGFDSFSGQSIESNEQGRSSLEVEGQADISNLDNVAYEGKVKLRNFNLKNFSQTDDNLPINITGSIDFYGKGTNPNTILLKMNADFQEFAFTDRQLFPFSVSLDIQHQQPFNRSIRIYSDIFKLTVEGNYEFSSLVGDVLKQFNVTAQGLENKLMSFSSNSVVPTQESSNPIRKTNQVRENFSFNPANIDVQFEIRDFLLLGVLFKTDINFSGFGKFSLNNLPDSSSFEIDTFHINFLNLLGNGKRYSFSNSSIRGFFSTIVKDFQPKVKTIKFMSKSESRSYIGDLFLDYFDCLFELDGENINYTFSTLLNSEFSFDVYGNARFLDKVLEIDLNKFLIGYENIFQWSLSEPTKINVSKNNIIVKDVKFSRDNAENISISAQYSFNDSINAKLGVQNLPLTDFQKLLSSDNSLSRIQKFDGIVSNLDIELSNTLSEPYFNVLVEAKGLSFDNISAGSLKVIARYEDQNIMSKISISSQNNQQIDIDISKFPFVMNLKEGSFNLIENEQFHSNIFCNDLNLSYLEPLVSNTVENLNGKSKIDVDVFGYLPDDLKFNGNADISHASFILQANNLKYYLKGKVLFQDNLIKLEDFIISNSSDDLKNGNALINGKILLRKNQLEDLELVLQSKGIKVLSQASAKSLPYIYGDLVISTFPDDLRFYFKGRELRLEGNVNILSGKLFMPGTFGNESVRESFVKYEFSDSRKEILKDTIVVLTKKESEPSNLKIDLTAKFFNPIELTIDITSLGQVYALISLEDNASSIRYYSDPKNNVTMLLGGDLVLHEGSTLKLVKLFRTEGKISFPTGRIDNPGLDFKAVYSGQSIYNDAVRDFKVMVYISGTRENPRLRFDYEIDGERATGDSVKIAQDAIFLLAFGRTKSEFERGGGSNFNFSEVSSSGSSALLSKLATQALSGTGFISSADILLPSSTVTSLDKATLQMSGRFLGMTWKFGGTMADLLNNNELSIEVPIGSILPFYFPNIILQLSRSSSLSQSIQRNQKDWEIKLKYGSSW